MGIHEIVLPETKPALEWVNGRVLQKVSPRQKHALAQGRFWRALDDWAAERSAGIAGTEWDFRIGPPGEIRRPLVPDVAFVSYKTIPRDREEEMEIPRVAPDAVVEIISIGDLKRDIEEKVRVYLAAGTNVVFLVDTRAQTVTMRDGKQPRIFGSSDDVEHTSLPGFRMPVRTLFDRP